MMRAIRFVLLLTVLGLWGCSDESTVDDVEEMSVDMADMSSDMEEMPSYDHLPYARQVVSFSPGVGAGYHAHKMPGVVLGPPVGKGNNAGSLDVVSLGMGGEIVLGFGDWEIVDGPGVDFVVFENPFWANGDPKSVFEELGEVSVSEDGQTWHTFDCDPSPNDDHEWPGCAGWRPTQRFDPLLVDPLVAMTVGGDGFDLETLGLEQVRFVRIRDLATEAIAPTAGFDLDAVGLIHAQKME